MFDIGWSELLVIGVVALLVIGPRDLPVLLKSLGVWAGKARAMAREFQAGLDDIVRESELNELKKSVEQIASIDVEGEIKNSIDPGGQIAKDFDLANIDPATPPVPLDPDAGFTPPERESDLAATAEPAPPAKTGTGD
jgi:sec-independent protein translocase protein TatB